MSSIEQGARKTILLILNEAAYGSERTYNGLRLAGTLSRRQEVELKLFLIGDAVSCARSGQKVPPGYYSTETMLAAAIRDFLAPLALK